MTTEVIAALDAIIDGFDDDTDALVDVVVPLMKAYRSLIAQATGTPTVPGEPFTADVFVRQADGTAYTASPRTVRVAVDGDEIIASLNDPKGLALHAAAQDITAATWYAQNDSYKALSFLTNARNTLFDMQLG